MATGWFRDSAGTWYLSDGSGAMLTGWQWRGAWYYMTSSGTMATQWLWDGAWYWLDPDSGAMATGWAQDSQGAWWLLSSSGALASNSWGLDADGQWRWAGSDGSMATGWLFWGNAWYWLDKATGVMTTGWVDDNGTYYWTAADGRMKSNGWFTDADDVWHYARSSGDMLSGWFTYSGAKYYLDPLAPQHPMVIGTAAIDGAQYYFLPEGAMARLTWVPVGDGTFRLAAVDGKLDATVVKAADGSICNATGVPLAGWISVAGGKAYVDPETGLLTTGWSTVDEVQYFFLPDTGLMATGWVRDNDSWYLFSAEGAMQTGWQLVDGTWYYLDSDTGAMRTGWLYESNTWYYLTESGAMATGWAQVDGKWYHFNASGAMQTGWIWDGGVWYYLLNNGALFRTGDVVYNLNCAASGGLSAFNTGKSLSDNTWNALNNAIANYTNAGLNVGFVMVDLTDGSGIAYNADWSYYSASTIKAPYVVAVNKLWPWELSNSEYNMYWALQTSNNFCYNSCVNTYGRFPLDAMVNQTNANGFTWSGHYAYYSARDLAKLWVGVSDYLLNGGQNSTWMQNVLSSNQYITSRGALSWTGATVYAKSGWLTGPSYAHNEGYLVMRGDHPYIVAIMSNSTLSQSWRMDALANAIDCAHSDLW